MCGIVGYIGSRPARGIILNGLKRLEYRGYDSAGMALVNGETRIFKCKGRVTDLEKMGVELLLCATCVSHYGLADIVGAGTLSNMYTIAEVMVSAGNIVRP